MGLISCKDCGAEISELAAACPRCGAPNVAGGQSIDRNTHEQSLAIERARLALEESFWKKKAVPLLSIVGIIIAGVFTTGHVIVGCKQKSNEMEIEHRRALLGQKIGLISKFALANQQSGNSLNAWHVFVLRRAKEECRIASERDPEAIKDLKSDERAARTTFYQVETPEGSLAQIGSLYTRPSVRQEAKNFQESPIELAQQILRKP